MMLKTRYGPLWMIPPSRNLLYVYWGKNQSYLNHLTQFPFIRLSQNKHISELLPPWNVINHPPPPSHSVSKIYHVGWPRIVYS